MLISTGVYFSSSWRLQALPASLTSGSEELRYAAQGAFNPQKDVEGVTTPCSLFFICSLARASLLLIVPSGTFRI